MRVIEGLNKEIQGDSFAPCVVALGTFDGIHRGHQALIREGKRLSEKQGALLRVCTFDRHPLEILRPEMAPYRLQTPEEQKRMLAFLGADELRIIPFTSETANMTPKAFLNQLRSECNLKGVVVGWNYSFGRRGSGNPELMQADGEKHGYPVIVVSPVVTENGEVISSTAIREKLTRSDLAGANNMLGYPYEISGIVVNGKHQGTRIGFPTANIETDARKQLPAYGVYACRMESEGQSWPAVVNIGLQPTLPSGKVTVEAHALDANLNLYGKASAVHLHAFLREERKFNSLGDLITQIDLDREAARALLKKTCQITGFALY